MKTTSTLSTYSAIIINVYQLKQSLKKHINTTTRTVLYMPVMLCLGSLGVVEISIYPFVCAYSSYFEMSDARLFPLHVACEEGDLARVRELVSKGGLDLNESDDVCAFETALSAIIE